MEALYKQRIAQYGWGSCYSAEYTRFLPQDRGKYFAKQQGKQALLSARGSGQTTL
jgi:hypothetical protein